MQVLTFSDWLKKTNTNPIVTLRPDIKTRDDLIDAASRIASYVSKTEAKRIAILTDVSFLFIASLYAVLSEKREAILLGSRKSVTDSRSELFDLALVNDATGEKEVSFSALLRKSPKPLNPVDDSAQILLYTSGSTGKPKAIAKSVALMDKEAAITTELFGKNLTGTTLATCVDPAHLYGLTFAIWMPVSLGIPLLGERLLSQEDFAHTPGPLSVIATPTFLRYLDTKIGPIESRFLLSAGGKLEESAIEKAHQVFACPVSEIYGSTEAGVIGTRCHKIGSIETTWRFCPNISLKETSEDLTTIKTPLSESGLFHLEDRLAFLDKSHFTLLGRKDRVVKIGEERISLDEIQAVVKEKLGFTSYAVAVDRGEQKRIGLVVELESSKAFSREKIPSYIAFLRGAVATVALPRFWREVKRFPANDRGKIDYKAMEALFDA